MFVFNNNIMVFTLELATFRIEGETDGVIVTFLYACARADLAHSHWKLENNY